MMTTKPLASQENILPSCPEIHNLMGFDQNVLEKHEFFAINNFRHVGKLRAGSWSRSIVPYGHVGPDTRPCTTLDHVNINSNRPAQLPAMRCSIVGHSDHTSSMLFSKQLINMNSVFLLSLTLFADTFKH